MTRIHSLLLVCALGCTRASHEGPAVESMLVASEGPAACDDHSILERHANHPEVAKELERVRAGYRQAGAEPTTKVNVQLRSGADVEALVARHGARAVAPVGALPDWYTMVFVSSDAAMAAVRPLLCDPDVRRAALNMKRVRVLREPG